jgi:hypothetical protein
LIGGHKGGVMSFTMDVKVEHKDPERDPVTERINKLKTFEGYYTSAALIDCFIETLKEQGIDIRKKLNQKLKEYEEEQEKKCDQEKTGEGVDMVLDIIFNAAGEHKSIDDIPEEDRPKNEVILDLVDKACKGATREEIKEELKKVALKQKEAV